MKIWRQTEEKGRQSGPGILLLCHGRICGIVSDRACVGSVLEADVAGLAPLGAPRVSDLPVGRGVHARGLHTVVHFLAAGRHDATTSNTVRTMMREKHTHIHTNEHGVGK